MTFLIMFTDHRTLFTYEKTLSGQRESNLAGIIALLGPSNPAKNRASDPNVVHKSSLFLFAQSLRPKELLSYYLTPNASNEFGCPRW